LLSELNQYIGYKGMLNLCTYVNVLFDNKCKKQIKTNFTELILFTMPIPVDLINAHVRTWFVCVYFVIWSYDVNPVIKGYLDRCCK
jgi:hypothetical protein